MNHILVAIDFSEVTFEVISQAVMLCKALGGELRVLHVDDSAPYSYSPRDETESESWAITERVTSENNSLEPIRVRLAAEQISVEYKLLTGPAVDNILAEARTFNAGIIVIGAPQHGKIYHLLFGDTIESLIHKSRCPILIVPLRSDT